MKLSIVVPVFNEEECIRSSYERIRLAMAKFPDDLLELIFVNDGSGDKTPAVLEDIRHSNPGVVRVLHFSRNFGHSAAVLAGLSHTTGEVIAIIDADMQDPPELIPLMVDKLKEGHDVVYGQRAKREGETAFKKFSAWAFYRIINLLSRTEIPRDTGDFRVMRRNVVEAVLRCKDAQPFLRGLVAWVGFRQVAYPYSREERKLGTTKYPLSKMLRFAWQAISSFSNAPLLLIVYLGLFMTVVSCLIGVWALKQYASNEVIPGWTSLLLGFVAGNAVTLLMLGIIGLYVGKIIDQVRSRPTYIIRND